MTTRNLTAVTLAALVLCQATPGRAQENDTTLQGAWAAESYVLKDGPTHRIAGRIFFTQTEWTVLFFVMDEQGEPRRGSGEGGTYNLHGNDLMFSHLFNFSTGQEMPGLAAAPLQLIARDVSEAVTEPSTIQVSGDQLTIFFPSGNRMTFTRSSR